MRLSIPALAVAILATTAAASYVLEDDYATSNFASMFDFFTDNDPTNGYVNYVSQEQAQSSGLFKTVNGAVYMGVDSTNVASGRGRDSVRISSQKTYNNGLIILDLAHMPAGACGTWPAFWTLGPNWPNNGEIDIIEGVNGQTTNRMAGHTDAGCTVTNTGAFSGTLLTDDCNVAAANQGNNVGCSISSGSTSSYGAGFNANGGGVFATEWTSQAITFWFFPRGAIPADIPAGNPDPTGWGLPQGQFTGGCDIDEKFKDQQLVFDVTFCGDWAGGVWSTDSVCSAQASSCQAFVQNNPSAFQDTYWLINGLKVYSQNGAGPTSNPAYNPTSNPATNSSSPATPTTATTLTTVPGETTSNPTPPAGTTTAITATTTLTPTTYATPTATGVPPVDTQPAPTTPPSPNAPAAATPPSNGNNGGQGWPGWGGGAGSGNWGGGRGGGGGWGGPGGAGSGRGGGGWKRWIS